MEIHFVCTGNLLRSVLCERLAIQRAPGVIGDAGVGLVASSSGLEADPGQGAHRDCETAMELLGLSGGIPAPTRTSEEVLERADLVVAMTRQQCYVLASRYPAQRRKVFSLIEINGAIETLMDGSQGGSGGADGALDRATEALQTAGRETMRPLPGVPLDIRQLMTLFGPCFYQVSGVHDPMGGTPAEVERCARILDEEVTNLLAGLLRLGSDLRG